jgi:hypothetical protein
MLEETRGHIDITRLTASAAVHNFCDDRSWSALSVNPDLAATYRVVVGVAINSGTVVETRRNSHDVVRVEVHVTSGGIPHSDVVPCTTAFPSESRSSRDGGGRSKESDDGGRKLHFL